MDVVGDFFKWWFDPKYEWLWGVVVPVTLSVIGLTIAGLAVAFEWVRDRLRS